MSSKRRMGFGALVVVALFLGAYWVSENPPQKVGTYREVVLSGVDSDSYGTFLVLRVSGTNWFKTFFGIQADSTAENSSPSEVLDVDTTFAFSPEVAGGENSWYAANLVLGQEVPKVPYLRVRSVDFSSVDIKKEDLIVEIDGGVASQAQYWKAEGLSKPVDLTVVRDGKFHTVTAKVGVDLLIVSNELFMDPSDHPAPRIPQSEHGRSSGLPHALALIDALSSGDLSGSRRIAATGFVGLTGKVGVVGGITKKTQAAIDADASVMLVPARNFEEAFNYADGRIKVVPVTSVALAVDWLCLTATSDACLPAKKLLYNEMSTSLAGPQGPSQEAILEQITSEQ